MVENYQAAYLAKSPQDPSAAAQGLSAEALARFELQEKLQYPDEFVAPRNLLEHAKARLAMFTAIGITADFGNSLTRISAALNCAAPQSCARRNVNPEPISVADLDRTTLALIRELTEIDQCLYEWVLSRLYAN